MIKSPPSSLHKDPLAWIAENESQDLQQYFDHASALDTKGRYLHFDELRFRLPKGLNVNVIWSLIKKVRAKQLNAVLHLDEPERLAQYYFTPTMQKAISMTDRHATSASLEYMCSKVGEQKHFEYLLNDLIEDEAISSSQLEGAATTTKVAKDLLKRARKPRTIDEKMIIGNFKMMQFAWQNRHKRLSIELIQEMHQVGVENIDDEKYHPGVFRQTDDVEVADSEGNTVHTPPPAARIDERLEQFVEWVNQDNQDEESNQFMHPLIKAIVMHFVIGFEHPFRDGNGRVARSLFYWFMFKNDYAAFRYIAISVLLKAAPIQYGKSYLYTESDELDLTYFIDYQCKIITRAISEFKLAYETNLKESEAFSRWLWSSGLLSKLSDKQKTIVMVAKNGKSQKFTAVNVKENLGCSYNTARDALNGLVELNLFDKAKEGKEWVFALRPQKDIIQSWE
ncbi:cell filamentation protein Fic [Pseudoalteromonas phenolica]|uniref:Cell filamentation protein Fic n=1 Tax=Pseudoalteromonas phenolica TaxID=161398 RepID=A0A5R9PYW1_9GAMM|nr:Fic family protein [Pseudoalteromonas phenolica]TLX46078.1 cell filamentation protein Fic [Pseudoalteromonas phenolica]